MIILDFEKLDRIEREKIMGDYLDYLETHRKNNYSDTKPTEFEQFISSEYFKCNNCNEWVLLDNKGTTELALTDNICENCMKEGYGK